MEEILSLLDARMETPAPYGWFHLLCLALTALGSAALCFCHRHFAWGAAQTHRLVFVSGVVTALLEIYKQINFNLSWQETGLAVDVQWYAFPWQFCSMPMYVSLLTGVFRRGKIRRALYAFLGSYAVFAGLCVMLCPNDVFTGTIGINIQTMVCHGSMVAIGLYLLHCGCVPLRHSTIVHALPVFAASVALAMLLNEAAFRTGLLAAGHVFNMFFISPYLPGTLPVYSLVQAFVPYPWCLVIYILCFTAASWLILVLGMGLRRMNALLTSAPRS